jgi:hypothetical protein
MPGKYIAACDLTDDQIQVFAIQTNGSILTRWKATPDPNSDWTAWSAFQGLPGGAATSIAAAALPDKRPQLFATDVAGNTWSCWKSTTAVSASWTPWSAF